MVLFSPSLTGKVKTMLDSGGTLEALHYNWLMKMAPSLVQCFPILDPNSCHLILLIYLKKQAKRSSL